MHLSCNHNSTSDLTQGRGNVRNYYCHACGMHFYKGREWTAEEWSQYVEDIDPLSVKTKQGGSL